MEINFISSRRVFFKFKDAFNKKNLEAQTALRHCLAADALLAHNKHI